MSSTATSRSRSAGRVEQDREAVADQTSQSQASDVSMQESIQQLAYALWERRGCPEGSPEKDWREAEQQVQSLPSETRSLAV